MSATMQIAKTAQTKAAFHHGSTVPYGMAAITIRPSSAPKTILLATDEKPDLYLSASICGYKSKRTLNRWSLLRR